ncbi:UbiA prenyltransferase family-domain-containing protein [Dendryphion nanum]|uniref:UbiA prenyltransferase family-domain-containing protein n=1 Tax=Dendryphion nanum TaxID=256645 RepID=A0A9P9E4C4_9PLEO|nr:UbiA prenyltransferase family-domain-containing protein [Dendryphion nanum]
MLLQSAKLLSQTSTSPNPTIHTITTHLSALPTLLKTLYLFTANDFTTFAIPTTLFALFASLSGPLLTTNPSPSLLPILSRLPAALLIVWANLLIFNISNQRTPTAVAEDKINKPHRPLPSGRISTESSRRLLLCVIPLVLALGWALQCWQETLLLFTATWMYNDLQGCDEDWVLRNALIALGYGLYSSAALRVVVGRGESVTGMGIQWVGIVTAVMFVTQHICDIKDVEGDRIRGRRSAPIVLGDEMVRWSVAAPVVVCSVLCPAFFGLGVRASLITLGMGALVAGRTVVWRDLKSDKLTWKLWAAWTVGLFALPLVSNHEVLGRLWGELLGLFCAGSECTTSLNVVAVSGVTLAVEGRRLYGQIVCGEVTGNVSVPTIIVDGVS